MFALNEYKEIIALFYLKILNELIFLNTIGLIVIKSVYNLWYIISKL